MEDILQLPHKLTLDSREKLIVTGVTEVLSFDEGSVVMKTHLGTLTVLGENLVLKTLSAEGGNLAVSGHVSAVQYEEARPAGFWQRLLR